MIERQAAHRSADVPGEDGPGELPAPGRPSRPGTERTKRSSAAARRAASEHHDQHGQPITRDALRARLGVSNQAASDLLRQLRAGQDRPPGAPPRRSPRAP